MIIRNIFNGTLEDNGLNDDEEESEKKNSKGDKFLSPKFRLQIKDLMRELQNCDVHFVRCIKPNEEKKRNYFVPAMSLNQIRSKFNNFFKSFIFLILFCKIQYSLRIINKEKFVK